MSKPLKLNLLRKLDGNGKPYFMTVPGLPCLIDLSKVVIFVYPGEGSQDTEMVIKEYTGKERKG